MLAARRSRDLRDVSSWPEGRRRGGGEDPWSCDHAVAEMMLGSDGAKSIYRSTTYSNVIQVGERALAHLSVQGEIALRHPPSEISNEVLLEAGRRRSGRQGVMAGHAAARRHDPGNGGDMRAALVRLNPLLVLLLTGACSRHPTYGRPISGHAADDECAGRPRAHTEGSAVAGFRLRPPPGSPRPSPNRS
jgi:hypothetical protein